MSGGWFNFGEEVEQGSCILSRNLRHCIAGLKG